MDFSACFDLYSVFRVIYFLFLFSALFGDTCDSILGLRTNMASSANMALSPQIASDASSGSGTQPVSICDLEELDFREIQLLDVSITLLFWKGVRVFC